MTDTPSSQPPADQKRTRKRQGPREGTAQRRQEILDAAMQVFATKGFHGGTLADVAKLAGMTNAGILHHFGSKDHLLQAVIDHRDNIDSSEAHAAYGLDFFRHLIATARLNATRPGIIQTYVVLSAEAVTEDNPGGPYFTGRFEGLRELVLSQMRTLTPPDDPLPEAELQAAASNVIALMDGLQVQWLLNPDSVDLVDATAFGIDAILRAVAAGAGGVRLVGPDD
jgi:AcrR family transcriptional regulator